MIVKRFKVPAKANHKWIAGSLFPDTEYDIKQVNEMVEDDTTKMR